MKKLFAILTAACLASAAAAQDATVPVLDMRPSAEVSLSDFLWLNRVFVVFADTERDPSFQRQMELLAERPAELAERDVIIVIDTNPSEPSEIRKSLRPRGFSFVFIDKDGVVKLRKPAPWHVREIIRSIDKTELRQREIREAQSKGS